MSEHDPQQVGDEPRATPGRASRARMPHTRVAHVRGLVLAAGEGRRMGGPKALVRTEADGPTLVERAVTLLLDAGCDGVTVVVGAAAPEVTTIVEHLGRDVDVVTCPDWHEGLGASLRAGLTALARSVTEGSGSRDATLVTLVDLPDLTPEVARRILTDGPAGAWRAALARAAYGGVPGHPALIGHDHWDDVAAAATGDRGAREYFRGHAHRLVECGDLATGHDVDSPADLPPPRGPLRGRP